MSLSALLLTAPVARASGIADLVAKDLQSEAPVDRAHITGKIRDRGDLDFQRAIAECEWHLSLAIEAHTELAAPRWPEVAVGKLDPQQIERETEILAINHIENRKVPMELMATDYSIIRFKGDREYLWSNMKEIYVLTNYHAFHHYPGQGPSIVEPDEKWEHERMFAALMQIYRGAYDAATLAMVQSVEGGLPRHRKKIVVMRQPFTPAMSIYAYNPDIKADYIATAALFDATQDSNGPRPHDAPTDHLSPVERVLKNEGRGKNVIAAIQKIREAEPSTPIFEWQNYIIDCQGRVNALLCALQLQGWFLHRYLKNYARGYVLIHTMKESTTQLFESRSGFARSLGDAVIPVMKDDESGEQVFPGEHVFLVPIQRLAIGILSRNWRALAILAKTLPGFGELTEKHLKFYNETLQFYAR